VLALKPDRLTKLPCGAAGSAPRSEGEGADADVSSARAVSGTV
jgi:hypothetical protein